ncbi:MAG: glycerol-3-phosphate dehydrogenase/oxidase [Desulfobacteraceae bacterium]
MNLKSIQREWDLIVIGGGVTGAGILREAARTGCRVLLLEKNDFAWGTSSRSSKMVHGGFRYLQEGKFSLTRIAVKERERLLREVPGLVDPLEFLLPVYKDRGLSRWALEVGLSIYDLIAWRRDHRFYNVEGFSMLAPHLNMEELEGGFRFTDAQVDDARLVLRLMDEAVASGPQVKALNYITVDHIQKDASGQVRGVEARDTETGVKQSLQAPVVINATGFEAETFQASPDPAYHLRPLRGSHLVFPLWCLPTGFTISFLHPRDGRYAFVCPWEGRLLAGTTDLDHTDDPSMEPAVTREETDYLMEGLHHAFPGVRFPAEACVSSFAGVRPVLSRDHKPPSHESREHAIWVQKGLVTATGGKLTTFRRLAHDALKAARPFLPPSAHGVDAESSCFAPVCVDPGPRKGLSHEVRRRLVGRYGNGAAQLIKQAPSQDLEPIPHTRALWAELPFAAAREQVRHLSDLLLRRVRVGILSPQGGARFLDRIEQLCSPVLSWDPARWEQEKTDYLNLWAEKYAPPRWQ